MSQRSYILYLKDEQHPLLEIIHTILAQSGYVVQGITSHKQGLPLIHSSQPDVILLDLTAPDSESWLLYHAIKSNKKLAGIPIIDVSTRIPAGGRIILDEDRSSPIDLERVIRSIKVFAQKGHAIAANVGPSFDNSKFLCL